MIRFVKYKNSSSEIELDNNSISNSDFIRILQIIDSQILPEEELDFEFEDLDKNKNKYRIKNSNGFVLEQNSKPTEYKTLSDFLSAKVGVAINSATFKNAVLTITPSNVNDLKSLISKLDLGINFDAEQDQANNKKDIDDIQTKIEEGLSDEQKSKYKRLEELNTRVESIQTQIDFYQNEKKLKEDLNNNIKKLAAEKETMSQMLQSVELLLKNREELESKVNSYNGLAHSPESIKELKSKKISYLNTKLFSNKNPTSLGINDEEEEKKESKLKINFNVTVIFTILNLVITLIAFLYSYSINVLIFGLLFSLVLMVLYIISRFFKDSLEGIEPEDIKKDELEEKTLAFNEPEDPNAQLFINSAWANALKSELQILDSNIQKNLNGKSHEQLKSDQAFNEEAVKKENQKLEDLNAKSLTSDEYYKKRRELDILKIERENLEFDLKLDPEQSKKLKDLTENNKNLNKKGEYIKKFKETFPIFLIGTLEKGIFSTLKQDLLNQLVLVNSN